MSKFDSIFHFVSDRMVIDRERAEAIYNAVIETSMLPGDMAELGVYRGGVSKLMALASPFKKKIWMLDTFAGLPKPGPGDLHHAGEFASSVDEVRAWMNGFNHELIVGTFPASVPQNFDQQFSLVHLDGDLYQTTRDGLEFFWPRMVHGGKIILDDWLWPNCPGVAQAVWEFEGGKRWQSTKWQLTICKR